MRNKRQRGAGLLPAAVEEINRLRAEWAALKESDLLQTSLASKILETTVKSDRPTREFTKNPPAANQRSCEVLRGAVALVEVGAEHRALPLRAALTALGATVVPLWSPLVTHVVWSEGGDRKTRAKARASGAHVVSPLWVEACAASNRRLSEKSFPATTRPSDLPSPHTLLTQLKRAERENLPLTDLIPEKRHRMGEPVSTATSRDVGSDDSRDASRDTTASTSHDTTATSGKKSRNKTSTGDNSTTTDVETRVNTNPRRALPLSSSPGAGVCPRPDKALRKLFTQREVEPESDCDSDATTVLLESPTTRLTQRDRDGLARAERVARRMVRVRPDPRHPARPGPARVKSPPMAFRPQKLPPSAAPELPRLRRAVPSQDTIYTRDGKLRIVLTGMSRAERCRVYNAVKQLDAKVQKVVNNKTTHVVVGHFGMEPGDNVTDVPTAGTSRSQAVGEGEGGALRTLNALGGAARGCRVVCAQWVLDSLRARQWLCYRQYAVPHLRTIAEKAFLERHAFDLMNAEYAYNIFHGRRVRLSTSAENRRAAEHLLALCGAVVVDDRGHVLHNAHLEADQLGEPFLQPKKEEVVIGAGCGHVSARWVFDSVAAARMRSTRLYTSTAAG